MMNNTQQELIQNEQQFVKGRVKSVFFQSNDSFYKVILISVKTDAGDPSGDSFRHDAGRRKGCAGIR